MAWQNSPYKCLWRFCHAGKSNVNCLDQGQLDVSEDASPLTQKVKSVLSMKDDERYLIICGAVGPGDGPESCWPTLLDPYWKFIPPTLPSGVKPDLFRRGQSWQWGYLYLIAYANDTRGSRWSSRKKGETLVWQHSEKSSIELTFSCFSHYPVW